MSFEDALFMVMFDEEEELEMLEDERALAEEAVEEGTLTPPVFLNRCERRSFTLLLIVRF